MNKARILQNLKGRTNMVAIHCALAGFPVGQGFDELSELIRDGFVEKRMVPHGYDKRGRPLNFPMYRSVPQNPFGENTSLLNVVK